MKQKNNILLIPIIFSAITSYAIYDILCAFLYTILVMDGYVEYSRFWGFVTGMIFPFCSACISIIITNRIIMKEKTIPALPFLVSLGIAIIIFIVAKAFRIVASSLPEFDYILRRFLQNTFYSFSLGNSLLRNILFAILVGIGETIVLKFLQIMPENISIPRPVVNQANYTNTITGGEGMFCRNCGNMMDNNAVICVKCGAAKGSGNSYCPNCGKETNPNAAVCLNCGYALTNTNIVAGENAKSKLVAGLLALFLGGLGIHNFYLGYTQKGVIQLLVTLLGSCLFFIGPMVTAIWALVEAIFIFTGKINVDGKGNPLKD